MKNEKTCIIICIKLQIVFILPQIYSITRIKIQFNKNNMMSYKDFEICVATKEHLKYANNISEMIAGAAGDTYSGLAFRTPEYITEKMIEGKAIIAVINEDVAGFCYIEQWSHGKFIANSGLIVTEKYRGLSLAHMIKKFAFKLSRKQFPNSLIFGLTTSPEVMYINSKLGYRPVVYSDLTLSVEFWDGCKSCSNFDILQRTNNSRCLCTAMCYNPMEFNIEDENKLSTQMLGFIENKS